MINRLFHHIWFGPLPVPVDFLESWWTMHPTWDHRLWREKDIRAFGLVNSAAFEFYMRRGIWHGAADVARIEILAKHGGVYVDADLIPLRSFDGAPFMSAGFFSAYSPHDHDIPGLLGTSCLGATSGHPVLSAMTGIIARRDGSLPAWRKVGPVALTRAVAKAIAAGCDDIYIAPSYAFYPHDKSWLPTTEDGPAYARHLWGSTRTSAWHYGDSLETAP